MTRNFLLVALTGAFASCVSGTYDNMMPTDQSYGQQGQYIQGQDQKGQYMQGSSQDMSMGSGSSSGASININIINQPIIIIATNAGGSSQTQTINSQIQPAAATHTITVGGDAGLIYSPDTINAAMYDMVQFNFMAKNHTVTQSTFPKPCNKMMGGVDSGFMPFSGTGTPPMMMLQVNSTKPQWFYCRQKKPMPHCGAGMTFSINPTADKSQAAFKAQAIAINGTGTAGGMMMGSSMPAAVASSMPAAAASSVPPAAMSMPADAVAAAAAAAAAATTPAAAGAQQNTGSMDASGSMNAGSNPMMVSGTGQMDAGGTCTCSCMCGTQAFAADSGLGLGMAGGLPAQIAAIAQEIASL